MEMLSNPLVIGGCATAVAVGGIALCMGGSSKGAPRGEQAAPAKGNGQKKKAANGKKEKKAPKEAARRPEPEPEPTPEPAAKKKQKKSKGNGEAAAAAKAAKAAEEAAAAAFAAEAAAKAEREAAAAEAKAQREAEEAAAMQAAEAAAAAAEAAAQKAAGSKKKKKKAKAPAAPAEAAVSAPAASGGSRGDAGDASAAALLQAAVSASSSAADAADALAAAAEEDEWSTVKTNKGKKSKALAQAAAAGGEAGSGGEGSGGEEDGAAAGGGGSGPPATVIDLGVFVSSVIGKSGATIKAITDQSGARIKVGDRGKDGAGGTVAGSSLCTITGDEMSVATAAALITEILSREQAAKDARVEITLEVGNKMPAVMGKAGATIKKIIAESGASVNRVAGGTVGVSEALVLSGLPAQVEAAKALVEVYMAGGPPPECREEVELGSERGRFVVLGPKGATVRQVQDESGAKVILEAGKTFVAVEGDAAQVAAAVAALHALLDANSQVEKVSVKAPDGKSHLAAIIGKGGAVIRHIRDVSGAAVDLLSAEDVVKVSGSREQVAKGAAMVRKILADEFTPAHAKLGKGEVCEDVVVPVAAVGLIIGRMGITIKSIKDATGANVDVPKGGPSGPQADPGVPTTVAKVFGPKDGVAAAVGMMGDLLKKHGEQKARDAARAAASKARAAKDLAEGKALPQAAAAAASGKGAAAASGEESGAVTFFGVEEDDDEGDDEGGGITFAGEAATGAGWDAEPSAGGPPGLAAAPGWS